MKKEIISGLVFIIVGCLAVVFRKSYAKRIIEGQKTFLWGINFGEREVVISKIIIIIAGILFILFGFMELGFF